MVERIVFIPKQFQDARGDVGAFGIEHGVVVGKGDFFQDIFGAILVKGAPPAVPALKRERPFDPAPQTLVAELGLPVGILRKASSTMAVSSTSGFHLFSYSKAQPLGSTSAGFLYCQSPRKRISLESNHSPAFLSAGWSSGMPDSCRQMATMAVSQTGEKTRLDPHPVGGFVFEALEFSGGPDDFRMIFRVAEHFEGDEAVEHGRENRGQAVAALQAINHPLLGLAEGAFAEGMHVVFGEQFGKLVQLIQPQEEIAPRKPLGVKLQGEVAFMKPLRVEFIRLMLPGRREGL